MKIGIDKISFYIPPYYIDMKELAEARNIDPNKYIYGLGQKEMAIPPLSQDIISMGANAANPILTNKNRDKIDLVILATESGTDFSKAGSTTIHKLLEINSRARCIELKQACYSATAALYFASNHIQANPNSQVLIIASDISRYGLKTSGEPTQGAGSVAMLIKNNPRLLSFTNEHSFYSDDIWDFWRPNYSDTALVDGQYSNDQYYRFFKLTLEDYMQQFKRDVNDFAALLFHIPYTKLGRKTLQSLGINNVSVKDNFEHSIQYNQKIGNVYTASLYLSLISLLDAKTLRSGDLLGLYSYGSGAVSEFFSLQVEEGYSDYLQINHHQDLINRRTKISINEYEKIFNSKLVENGSHMILNEDFEKFQLKEIKNHRRFYSKK